MNKNSFNPYLCINRAASIQQNCCGSVCLSQHQLIIHDMCFDLMMDRMMTKA
ncbi:hypothetical protein [Chryseobacterium herbae]|uniref:Uncharacterized protein n=1 Tax=Chryseobacterium herbae TaxID=2976476 RepID=A0ABT2IYM1_9FLAO|nr:hypothetical protein [Chryseobacterium sp. pc1-10]MCT2563410.1 hypothetical protein [Chryseobacterium sp. pc1-10]